MDSSDNVALTALVVGLAALLIAFGQLLQQIFGTADGYRRCQDSIIGPWAKRTRLVWRWSQFRFETKFTTPELVLYEDEPPGPKAVDLAADRLPRELQETVSAASLYDDASSDMVTWTLFLRQLYALETEGQSLHHEKTFEPLDASAYATPPPPHADSGPNKIAIIYRERTWDLMPTDAIRPMASARLGAMIVLAHKLGMTWESTQPSEGYLRADGNGHSLIASPVRGLGIVFSYSSSGRAPDPTGGNTTGLHALEPDRYIDSAASDKMRCGIVPGCRALGTPDLLFMGKRPAETSALIHAGFLKCGVDPKVAKRLTHRTVLDTMGTREDRMQREAFAFHDLVALIAPFMPTRGSSRTKIVWPMRTVRAFSAFHLGECRDALVMMLDERTRPGDPNDHLTQIWTRFQQLATDFGGDFYGRRNKRLVRSTHPADEQRKREVIDSVRAIHDWTTQYFRGIAPVLPYLDLVGAHVSLAYHCALLSEVEKEEKKGKKEEMDHEETGGDSSETALLYAKRLDELLVSPLSKKYRDDAGDTRPSRTLIVEAWWTLALRGTAWYMSVDLDYPEYMLPSKLYYDQTPVFIM